jgi:hypothetical protein
MPHNNQGAASVELLSSQELQLIEAALQATRQGSQERAAIDPRTGALQGVRPVQDGAVDFASVSAIARHGVRR